MRTWMMLFATVVLMTTAMSCNTNENTRLAEMAEQQLNNQAEQNRQMAELQRQVAEGSRRLVEADAKAREDMTALHRDLQAERALVDAQRDLLEDERREIAGERKWDSLLGAAVGELGLLLACVLPLLVCWMLLWSFGSEDEGDDRLVCDALLEDLSSKQPVLFDNTSDKRPRLPPNGGSDEGDERAD